MKNLLLTRYLYATDEVILSLLFALLNKENLNECYWWAYELYYSEINIKQIIWQIYYDFYAQLNPFLEKYIQTKFDKLDSGDETALAFIIRNLFHRQTTDSVFCIRLYANKNKLPNSIYKGKIPSWLESYDKIYHNLLRSIKLRNWVNIVFYLKKILNETIPNNNTLCSLFEKINIQKEYSNFENLYLIICDFICKQEEYIQVIENKEKILELFHNIKYNNYLHRLLALLAFITTSPEKININRLFISPTQEELTFIKSTNEPIELNKYNNPQIYNTIPYKRKYEINKNISCFALNRDYYNNEDLIEQYMLYWEYHCSNTPLWIRRFKRFGVCFDDTTFQPIFPNDDYQEMFYDNYGYEMDEPHVWNSAQLSFPELTPISKEDFNLSKYLEKVFENIDDDLRIGLDKIKISIKREYYYVL